MEEKKKELLSYLEARVAPILIDFLSGEDFENGVILPSNIDIEELNGHYEEEKYVPPKWLDEILNHNKKILVIDKIDEISKEEQMKFVELLEYRKISTFDLPNDCAIIVTAKEINKDKINEEIFSLVATI